MNAIPMDAISSKRDRLLGRTAQIIVTGVLATALVLLSTSATFATIQYWVALPLLLVAGLCTARISTRFGLAAYIGTAVMADVLAFVLGSIRPDDPSGSGFSSIYVVVAFLGAGVAGASIPLLGRPRGHFWFWVAGFISIAIAVVALVRNYTWITPLVLDSLVWIAVYIGGLTLVRSVPDALRQVREIGLAHRAERQASEMEANRRQSARLLHDTVLATLTLLAHSGVGVPAEALRSQARNDAHLLRQLRLGEPLFALPGAEYTPEPVEESTLGTTLESVRTRFDDLGLDVEWHGTSRIALPQHVLDAFLFSISESLENVRRHAGVAAAHVTVTETDTRVSAMITDSGKGFVPEAVSEQRLGIKESVIGRLAEVGGSAKVFSAPGAGTTVILEVPR